MPLFRLLHRITKGNERGQPSGATPRRVRLQVANGAHVEASYTEG
jgi:hypothetical protein